MKRYGSVLVLVSVAVSIAQVVMAATAEQFEQIEGWASFRNDTRMMQGALEKTVTINALRTYIPGIGIVFVMEGQAGISREEAQKEFEKALKYVVPTIDVLPDDECIVLAFSREEFAKEWEIVYVTTKKNAANPEAWTIYYNEMAME